ncbi:MAG: hypothetical protein UX58_C0005G0041 [Candidatus Wolfebacteria bacterium GW2011_GWB2_46_69]|uniref:Uncharacterized protein n=1 Tax=Candidatus Wolfebacteria bacterium GW2011_GWA2_47_9b TaxID=1619005 RepID=A0A0G1X5K8_9BACT|nr:MAG: hypothetical protein UX58_C0005G0041 [Candidatus Wolfebacteria bacterium GW2011_GWB2_46_69]KKU59092.1 MAG: hypothetical protein UX83_C0008G0042 [Candidatus Wolfebacteria bacterium GW2011_GWE2_47_12]KKU65666.1 MAG: hypothetical protein UX90_C0002G0042 [Candidatus Wolfebacteria bacterium GW2011_GWD2_47_17]KKU89695.1 MAG: hypothetical protein UY19_C0010G0028 [Candidatus Wolfebacteria bacterium GW2011_GWA2_47_9b]
MGNKKRNRKNEKKPRMCGARGASHRHPDPPSGGGWG